MNGESHFFPATVEIVQVDYWRGLPSYRVINWTLNVATQGIRISTDSISSVGEQAAQACFLKNLLDIAWEQLSHQAKSSMPNRAKQWLNSLREGILNQKKVVWRQTSRFAFLK